LPPLPPLPSLPRIDPQLRGDLPPPTFTPPAPPPPSLDPADYVLRKTLPVDGKYTRVADASPAELSADAGSALPVESWRTANQPAVASAPHQPASARSIGPDYRPAPANPGHPPKIPVVDPADYNRWDAERQGHTEVDEASSYWPEDDQYSPDEYEDYDEDYPEDQDYETGQSSAVSRLDGLRRRIRPWHAIAAVASLAVVSIGWSFLHRAGVDGAHEIATIEAPGGPMKVTPTVEPEPDAPTAGAAAVLDRNEPESVRKVVNNQEQAVDPSVAPQQNAAAVQDAGSPAETPGTVQLGAGRVDAPHEPPPASRAQQPRKVKSIAVPATPLAQPAAPATAALSQSTAQATAKPATGASAAQFASANSEAEARTLIKTLSGKYGGGLAGGKFTFKPVKTGDKTIYRVRVGGISREAAEAVCAKAKTGGDACAVVGN